MNLSKLLLILVSPLLLFGCKSGPGIDVNEVESLTFYTTQRNFETPNSLQSFEDFLEWSRDTNRMSCLCRDTTVTSRASIETFIGCVNYLRPSRFPYDLRTAVAINMKDGSTKYVGFGYKFGTSYEGRSMKDDDRLFKYLEDSIYSAHPKEYWMGEWEKKLNAGDYDYVDDELTGVKAFTMIKAETAPVYRGAFGSFSREIDKVLESSGVYGDTLSHHIRIQFIIDKKGNLLGARIEGKSRDELNSIERKIIKTVDKMQQWEPGTFNGEPVDVFLEKHVSY